MAKRDRAAMAAALAKRQEESGSLKSGGFISIFRTDHGQDVQFWKVKEGDHTLDIIPYEAGDNDPNPNVKAGDPAYVLNLKVHQGVGAAEGNYICPAENYNKPCPICEHRRQLKQDGADDDIIKALYPKQRCVYNIVVYDTPEEEEKGVQIWETSRFYSERLFAKLAAPKRRRGGDVGKKIQFASPEMDGKAIQFTREGTGATSTSYLGHLFIDRDYIIDDSILDQAFCLDDLISIPTYDELYEAYWGEAREDIEEKETSPAPIVRTRTRSRVVEKQEPAEEKEEPVKKKEVSKTVDNQCPGGGVFGVDIDKLEACEDCSAAMWKACAKAGISIKQEEPEEKEEPAVQEKEESTRRRRGRRG